MILSRFFRIAVVGVIGALSVFTRLGAMHGHVNWTQSIRAYRAGQQAYDQRKWSDARKEWGAAIASNPSSRFLLYNLATADSRTGDSTAATANLMRALRLGLHEFLQDDPELQSLHSAPTWPSLESKFRRAEEAFRRKHSDPRLVKINTDDVDLFWRIWDRLQGKSEDQWAELFVEDYLDKGTEALREYYLAKCAVPAKFADAIHKRADYYNAIRQTTLKADLDKEVIRNSFVRLKEMYPQAVFPDIYFVIGQLSSGGTSLPSGLLIGLEMNVKSADTPLGTLSAWEKANVGSIESVPGTIAHELVHYQQKGAGEGTLLEQVMIEGAADFIAEKMAHVVRNSATEEYAEAHEAELWKRFVDQKSGTDFTYWLYGTPPEKGVPSDLGYWVGRRICESYYERSTDKSRALIEIIEMRQPRQIYAGSRLFQ